MAIERWVVNASPLILLGKVDHLDLLFALTERVIVPQAVADEVHAKPDGIQILETLTRHDRRVIVGNETASADLLAWDLSGISNGLLRSSSVCVRPVFTYPKIWCSESSPGSVNLEAIHPAPAERQDSVTMISMSDTIENRTLMTSFPTIIDFEASSLASASYPIEVAWNLGETIEQHLIAPISRWTDWSARSQALHGISRAELIAHGQPPTRVCERLNRQLAGRVVYSDNPDFDAHWLEELFAASYGQTPQFQIGDFNALIDGLFAALPLEAQQTARHDFGQRIAVLNAGWTGRHRAGRDVAYLLRIHRAAVEVVEAFSSVPTPPPPDYRTWPR